MDLTPPTEGHKTGWKKKDSLQEALEAAWDEVHKATGQTEFQIDTIRVRGDNPIREYKIDFT